MYVVYISFNDYYYFPIEFQLTRKLRCECVKRNSIHVSNVNWYLCHKCRLSPTDSIQCNRIMPIALRVSGSRWGGDGQLKIVPYYDANICRSIYCLLDTAYFTDDNLLDLFAHSILVVQFQNFLSFFFLFAVFKRYELSIHHVPTPNIGFSKVSIWHVFCSSLDYV